MCDCDSCVRVRAYRAAPSMLNRPSEHDLFEHLRHIVAQARPAVDPPRIVPPPPPVA